MINTLIYSFSTQYTKELYSSLDFNKKLYLYINYYRASIKSSISLGYDVEIYLSEDCVNYFKDLDIQIHTVGNLDSHLFDFLKAYILNNRKDNFYLIDGDILFKHRIPESNCDIQYDQKCYIGKDNNISDIKKDKTWHVYYKPFVNKLTNLNIKNIIPEWTGSRYDYVHNIGVLYFNNNELKKIYVDRWYKFNDFINKSSLDNKIKYTAVGAQYLLTEIIKFHKFSSEIVDDKIYNHNIGTHKFKKPIFSDSYIQYSNKKNLL